MNAEVNINGNHIIRNDRNKNGGGVACYIRNDLCFNIKSIFSNSIEHVFFEILIPKVLKESLKTRGLYFCHLNVNSSLSKTDELRDITNYIRPSILGITESKWDRSVTNAEVNINGYRIIRNDRNKNGGGVACYIRNDLCFHIKSIFQILLNMLFSKFSLQKLNLL